MPHASHDSPATLLWGELSGYCRPDEGKTARITASAITSEVSRMVATMIGEFGFRSVVFGIPLGFHIVVRYKRYFDLSWLYKIK
jgi:hypothetical protein